MLLLHILSLVLFLSEGYSIPEATAVLSLIFLKYCQNLLCVDFIAAFYCLAELLCWVFSLGILSRLLATYRPR